MFRSATFKLTMWYLALVVAISFIFSVSIYNLASHEVARGLHHESDRITSQFPVFSGEPILRPNIDIKSVNHRLIYRLVGFNIIVIVGAGFASYWLARKTLQPIEEAHEQQKRFTADVSHELRTPLTALKMESEVALMSNHLTADELKATISSNLEEVNKLETLINNLLRLTKLEAVELRQNFGPVSAADVMNKAAQQLQKIASHRNIDLQLNLQDAKVFGDKDSLQQLLVILIDNSIKYSPNGSTVELVTCQQGNHVNFIVKDYGCGIDRESLEHIFDRFYQANRSRTTDTSRGFGLGLSIAKMIADIHDSSITISSCRGQGSEATIKMSTYNESSH